MEKSWFICIFIHFINTIILVVVTIFFLVTWFKVWSDYKNNTKKKAAKLHRAASGTGGGPACYAKLNDLEQRVLNLIGVHAATGLAVEEAGWSQVSSLFINHT